MGAPVEQAELLSLFQRQVHRQVLHSTPGLKWKKMNEWSEYYRNIEHYQISTFSLFILEMKSIKQSFGNWKRIEHEILKYRTGTHTTTTHEWQAANLVKINETEYLEVFTTSYIHSYSLLFETPFYILEKTGYSNNCRTDDVNNERCLTSHDTTRRRVNLLSS